MPASEVEKKKSIVALVYDIPSASKLTDLAPEGKPVPFPEVVGFEYFENLLDPFIRANLTILDSSGMIDTAFNNVCI